MSGPLDGVLVVSLEQAVAAPLASCRLADAGARVIKVERPEGDFARGYDVAANGIASYFAWINRGKESIALDLHHPDDRAVLERMVARADVFIQNLAVGAAARLGFDGAELRRRHPRLVVCELSGYGPSGPRAHAKAYDLLVQAESGLLSVSGPPGPMGRVGVSVVDIGTGMNAALGIVEALHGRTRTDQGALLHVSLFDSIAEWMTVPLLHHDYRGRPPERVGLAHPSIAPYGAFTSVDGATVLISVQSDREWRVLCAEIIGDPALGEDPRFATNDARVTHRAETDAHVARAFAALTRAELESGLDQARIAYGLVNDVGGLSAHPHLRRVTVAHERGSVALPAPPLRADWAGSDECGAVPSLDQQGAALRAEFAP